jgi:cyclic beta-1,2-glucan synthetase
VKGPPSLPAHLIASFDTSKDDVRADVEVCRRAQRTDGARRVKITRGNVLMGDQLDFLVGTAGRRLAKRLKDNGRVLLEAYQGVERAVREERAITPADEWLVDNFHIAQEQIRQIRKDLPRGFYRGLPKLADGPLAGYPRVFGLAWAFVAHTDSRFDRAMLLRFVAAYQRVQPLTIGELWAVAITLRVVLVENLRRSAEQIASGRVGRQEADGLADRLLGVGGLAPETPESALRRFDATRLPSAFVVRLLQRLRDQDPRVTPALVWLDRRLESEGTTAEAIVREEHQRQVGMNVTVRNVITSMRLVSALDWTTIFESMSLVDAALRAHSHFAVYLGGRHRRPRLRLDGGIERTMDHDDGRQLGNR